MIIRVPEYKKCGKPVNTNNKAVEPLYEDAQSIVDRWIQYYDIQNAEIVNGETGIEVIVHDNLFLPNKNISKFPFIITRVDGFCNLANNKFTSFADFPRSIGKGCIANYNLIRNFDGAPEIGGVMDAAKQKCRTDYRLDNETYQKYMNGTINENDVFVISANEYGKLVNISDDKLTCDVLIESTGQVNTYSTGDVDCLTPIYKLIK